MVNVRLSYPDEVVINDIVLSAPSDGTSTPAEQADDFFSSWDKPSIKRPSNPPSRAQTPPVISRTASPFLNPGANGNGAPRSKSPLNSTSNDSEPSAPARAVPAAVVRKSAGAAGPRKTNVLGAKKSNKLGAKKIGGGDDIDFDAAEKKAKEEADRIAKLGYDPDAEEEKPKAVRSASISQDTKMAAPTPVNPAKTSYGATKGHERTKSELERLGMGMNRLGFGQVGGSKPAAAPKKMGFGAVGASKSAQEGMYNVYAPSPLGTSSQSKY